MRNVLTWGGVALAGALAGTGCGGDLPTDPAGSDPSTLVAKVEANYEAVVLSVHAPYDTVRLSAVARNVRGEVLAHAESPRFRRLNELDLSVDVDSAGLVRTRLTTQSTLVEVSLTLNGVRRSDTVNIMVRGESPVVKIARLEFFPRAPDSAWRWAGSLATLNLANWVRVYNAQNQLISSSAARPPFAFTSSDPDVHVPSTGVSGGYINLRYSARILGEAWLRVKLFAYDTTIVDSMLFRRVEPTIKFVTIDRIVPTNGPPSIVFHPSRLEIKSGMTVVFMNRSGTGEEPSAGGQDFWGNRVLRATAYGDYIHQWVDSTGIAFDAPPGPVLAGANYGRLFLQDFNLATGFPADGGTGDIPSFSWVLCRRVNLTSETACGNAATRLVDVGYRSRRFTTPGTYRYTSTAFPDASGTIVVTAAP